MASKGIVSFSEILNTAHGPVSISRVTETPTGSGLCGRGGLVVGNEHPTDRHGINGPEKKVARSG